MSPEQRAELEKWLEGRPPIIRELAMKFHAGVILDPKTGGYLYVVGFSEAGELLVSETNPAVDYQKAVATRVAICADCLKLAHEVPPP